MTIQKCLKCEFCGETEIGYYKTFSDELSWSFWLLLNRTLKVSQIHKSQIFTFNRLFSLVFGCHSTVQNSWATLHFFIFWFQGARLFCNLKWCWPIVLQAFVFFFSGFFTHFQSSLVFSHGQRVTQRVISWKPDVSCHVVQCVLKKFEETGQAKTNNEVSDLKSIIRNGPKLKGGC